LQADKTLGISSKVAGIDFKNPIIPASGCFAFGREFAEIYDLSILGGIAIKAVSLEPREGNWTPRVAESSGGMLNSIGLQNPGLDKVINEELKFLEKYDTNIIVNVVGNSIDDYVEVSEKISKVKNVSALEINVSCPNVKNGIFFGTQPELLYELSKEIKKVSSKPVFIKLSPNVSDIVVMAKSAIDAGVDGLSLINTLLGMKIDIKTRKPVLDRKSGGLSGPAIKPVAIRMIYEVKKSFPEIPIIGMGGIFELDDVIEFLLAGASLVCVGTANFIDPFICPKLISELDTKLKEMKVAHISELVGAAIC
jgi:dihydroorotate dehydrogenase (NAD+) catalytic subunit